MENYDLTLSEDVQVEEREDGNFVVRLSGCEVMCYVHRQKGGKFISKVGSCESFLVEKEVAFKWAENLLSEIRAQ